MAGGWARDGAVNDQIDINTAEAVARARLRAARQASVGPAATYCVECDDPIPAARQAAIPGVQLCVSCQSGLDRTRRTTTGINRRASKDSLLK